MRLNAIGVVSTNIAKTVEFYTLLGFEFKDFKPDDEHVEPITSSGSARLMIDATRIVKDIIGEEPKAGFTVFKEPWDAFWGQRYAVVEDPDGYKVDLYASL